MEILIAISVITVFAAAIASFLVIRVTRQNAAPGSSDGFSSNESVEIARLQERERNLGDELGRQREAAEAATTQLSALQKEHADAREKLAAAEERVVNTQQTLSSERDGHTSAMKVLSEELAAVKNAREKLQLSLTEESQKVSASTQMEIELRDRIARAEGYIAEREAKIAALEASLGELRNHLSTSESDLAVGVEREAALNRSLAERDEQLKGLQERLKIEFENIATNVLKVATGQLSDQSEKSMINVLEPLKAQIIEFKQKVEITHVEDTKQRSALEAHIKQVAQTNQDIGLQAEALTKALKGDSQLRGRWGEVRLERILENSGLQRGREFVVQGGDFNIKNDEGGSQRPDVIILLPENRHFVIDSKVSLVDYLDYERAENEEARTSALKRLLASCRSHIDNLAGKKYQHADAINSHDLVFMFMPIEGVAALALQNDDGMFEYAWSRKIVMVSPSTLFMAMQTVSSIWRYERQSENALAIASQAGQLYDKLVGFVDDLNEVSQKIHVAANAHNEAMKKLSSGKGNALSRAQKLKALGVTSKKSLPTVNVDGEKHIIQDDDEDYEQVDTAALPAPEQ